MEGYKYAMCSIFIYDVNTFFSHDGRQIEGKVVEISRLQEIFAEKVLQQVS